MSITTEKMDKTAPRRPLRWALTMFGICMGVGLLFGLGVTPHLPASTSRVTPDNSPTAGLFYHSAFQTSYNSDQGGRIYIDASVNGRSVRFLIDPKAHATLLSSEDAVAAKIDTDNLTYSKRLKVGGIEIAVAPSVMRFLTMRELSMFQVPVLVSERPQVTSTLGTDFLERFDRYELKDGRLVLHW